MQEQPARTGPDTTAGFSPAGMLLLQFLAWVAARPRTYTETMAAWRTSCPRLAIWEDATADGLVEVVFEAAPRLAEAAVVLSAEGRARIGGAERDRPLRLELAVRKGDAGWTGPHANT